MNSIKKPTAAPANGIQAAKAKLAIAPAAPVLKAAHNTPIYSPSATPMDRILAHAIDLVAFTALYYGLCMSFGVYLGLTEGAEETSRRVLIRGVFKIMMLLIVGYHLIPVYLTGQTLGKKILGIKVVTNDGQHADIVNVLLRETIGRLCSTLFFGAGYIMIFFRDDLRSFHDLIANTKVIKLP